MDTVSTTRRSEIMRLVRSSNTIPEVTVRRLLHSLGYRFRLRSELPGRPDAVLPKYRVAVFVHGCFWHRHKGCPNTRTPKSRIDEWTAKFDANIKRDKAVRTQLRKAEWRQLVIWECELKNALKLKARIQRFMDEQHAQLG